MSLVANPLSQPVALSLFPTKVSVLPSRVAAGFASPAKDHTVQRLTLGEIG